MAGLIARWLDLLSRRTRMIQPTIEIPFPRERKDARFLICAESGRADALITGDGDFDRRTDHERPGICRAVRAGTHRRLANES